MYLIGKEENSIYFQKKFCVDTSENLGKTKRFHFSGTHHIVHAHGHASHISCEK